MNQVLLCPHLLPKDCLKMNLILLQSLVLKIFSQPNFHPLSLPTTESMQRHLSLRRSRSYHEHLLKDNIYVKYVECLTYFVSNQQWLFCCQSEYKPWLTLDAQSKASIICCLCLSCDCSCLWVYQLWWTTFS